jgi:phenylacetate-CoA ligase
MNLYQDIFFRGLDTLRGRNTIQRLHLLRQSQHWNAEQIASWQLEKLNALLAQAKTYSPFHKSRLAHINLPLTSLDQITQIPILTKTDIRRNQKSICCTNISPKRFVESRTGGSTAEPMFYFWDKQGMDWNRASVYRSAEWANTALGERTVQMSGSNFDLTEAQSLKNKIVYFLQRYRHYSVAYLNDEVMEKYYQQLMTFRPTSIWGYASGLSIFADFILKNHADADFSFLKAIMTSSEMLWPNQRIRINQAFGGDKVFNQYGSRELYMAAECKAHKGFHIHAEVILAEIVDPKGNRCKPGETGRVILTDLTNHAFPFIRYEIGDLGVMEEPGQCECGMWLPRLRSVEGRIADVIVLKDRVLTPPNFATLFSDIRGIKAYQIRQDKIDEIEVVLVPDDNYSSDFEKYVRGAIESMVAGQAKVRTTLTSEIKVPESGKRRFIVSNISKDHF